MSFFRKAASIVAAGAAIIAPSISGASNAHASDVLQLNVVNAYTPGALQAAGSLGRLEDLSTTSANAVNTAMSRSNIPIHINIVGMTKTTGLPDSAGESAILDALQDNSGRFHEAKAMRNAMHAHVLMTFINTGDSEGGLSFQNTASNPDYSIGTVDVAGDIQTKGLNYAHEFGHVLGADHDKATNPFSTGTANGYADPKHGIRDLMSYPTACTAAHVNCTYEDAYSDPNLKIDGYPMGNASANVAGWMRSHIAAYSRLNSNTGASKSGSTVTVSDSTPASGAQHVAPTSPLSVTLSGAATNLSAHLENSNGGILLASVHYNPSTHRVTFNPYQALAIGGYRLVVSGSNLPEQTIPFTVGYGASALRASADRDNQTFSVMFSKPDRHLQDSVDVITPSGSHLHYMASGYTSGGSITTYTLSTIGSLPHGTYTIHVHDYVADGLSVAGADRTFTVGL